MMPVPVIAEIGVIPIIVVGLVALLIFGHKLPAMARGLGSSVKEFKKGIREGEDEANTPDKPEPPEVKK